MPRKITKGGAYIDGVRVKKFKTSDHLIKRIAKQQRLDEKEVRDILEYNIITVNNLAKITGITKNHIHAKTKGYIRRGTQIYFPLNICDPFGDEYMKFIYRNAKCQELIERKAGYIAEMDTYNEAQSDLDEQEK